MPAWTNRFDQSSTIPSPQGLFSASLCVHPLPSHFPPFTGSHKPFPTAHRSLSPALPPAPHRPTLPIFRAMTIGKLKVGQLRKELEARGLDTKGTRPALMKRLREALDREGERGQQQKQQQKQPAVAPGVPEPNELPTHYPVETPTADNNAAAHREAVPQTQEQDMHQDQAGEHLVQHETEKTGNEEHVREQVRETDSGDLREDGVEDGRGAAATGSLARASETDMDERLRKRRERFGAVERASVGEKRGANDEDSEEQRRFEEAKMKRAAKFGPVSGVDANVSQEERERRLKRQRRFQSLGDGNATAV